MATKKQIWIAGCSFSAANKDFPNMHWSQILAEKLDCDYNTLARDSASNGLIMEQIDHIIDNEKPDLVIFNSTLNPRIEFPRNRKKYDRKLGIFQFFYYDKEKLPGFHSNTLSYLNLKSKFDSTPTNMIAESVTHTNRIKIMADAGLLIKYIPRFLNNYLDNFYDLEWETKKQVYMMQGVISRLERNKINYLFMPSPSFHDYKDYFKGFDKHKILFNGDLNVYTFYDETNPEDGFGHLPFVNHKTLGNNIYNHILKYKLLDKYKYTL